MPINVVKVTPNEFQPPRKFLFCYHPHGVLFLGAATVGNTFDKYHKYMLVSVFSATPLPFTLVVCLTLLDCSQVLMLTI